MKITIEELRKIIREQVDTEQNRHLIHNKRVALKAANKIVRLVDSIGSALQELFQDDDTWRKAQKHLDAVVKIVVAKQNTLEKDPMKKLQAMDMSSLVTEVSDAESKYEDWMASQPSSGQLIRAKRALVTAKSELTKAFDDSIASINDYIGRNGYSSSQDVEDIEAAYKEAIKSIDVAIAKVQEVKDVEAFILDT